MALQKDGEWMASDYDNPKEIKVLMVTGIPYIKVDDLISWLKENVHQAKSIETNWLIKVFVRLKNITK